MFYASFHRGNHGRARARYRRMRTDDYPDRANWQSDHHTDDRR